jgi:hypothetical protein
MASWILIHIDHYRLRDRGSHSITRIIPTPTPRFSTMPNPSSPLLAASNGHHIGFQDDFQRNS